jgi:hypothetical protein
MSHRSLRRHLTAGVLAAVLAGAAPAQARDLGTAGRAWLWLQDAWTRGVSALWDRTPVAVRRGGGPEDQRKEGDGLDPNGAPKPSSAAPACASCSDQGAGLDPLG